MAEQTSDKESRTEEATPQRLEQAREKGQVARSRDLASAMTLMAAQTARSQGYRIGVLTASPMGINIYRRLGFRECCTVSTYEG